MKNKVTMTVFGIATLLALGSTSLVFAHDCNPCAAAKPEAKKAVEPAAKPPAPKPVVNNACNPCAVPPPPKPVVENSTTSVSYHPIKSGTFHEQIVSKDANGNPLASLDISGSSVKVGVDWTAATDNVFTSGTHTTKYNSATVVEVKHQ